ncbi:RNA ligase T4 Rnl1, N-terminal [uncultured Caudovirales phage]|uniref:RNA ligase T4 Rnl1, N-terminal n=1 Tax=uncultured Caudovirales phage TaxID=2100421 RepID=A0A6J5KUB4_9CAUD|nr:RNA ligase T4 Rnl1, N-terminal [uncultured Caudovirales phage]CAB5208759.1 RNA ligase T4 Rnl1, N-terminal [uncultured Caudovirales phage]
MFKDELKEYVTAHPNLVSMKPAGDGIFVLKYKKRVFFDGLWNDYLEECRGTIVDADFNVVTRPFTKIYNYGVEAKAPKLSDDTIVTAYRKVNGFMVAVTWHNGDILVSTTGTTDSDYVKMARELIDLKVYREVCKQNQGITFMFECVHELDPHIVPELPGMYLLGYRENTWDSISFPDPDVLDELADQFGVYRVKSTVLSIGTLLKAVKLVKHEGFVFYTADGVSAKIKSPYYLVNKFVARNPRTDKLLRKDIKQSLDEEYYPLIDKIQENIVQYTEMDEQARLAWVRNFLEKS